MIEQNQTNTGSNSNVNQQHLIGDIEGDDTKDEEKISARRKIEDLLEVKRLKALTQDFDFDDL